MTSYLTDGNEGKRTISSGAEAQFLLELIVGAEAPTPGALIHENVSSENKSESILRIKTIPSLPSR